MTPRIVGVAGNLRSVAGATVPSGLQAGKELRRGHVGLTPVAVHARGSELVSVAASTSCRSRRASVAGGVDLGVFRGARSFGAACPRAATVDRRLLSREGLPPVPGERKGKRAGLSRFERQGLHPAYRPTGASQVASSSRQGCRTAQAAHSASAAARWRGVGRRR